MLYTGLCPALGLYLKLEAWGGGPSGPSSTPPLWGEDWPPAIGPPFARPRAHMEGSWDRPPFWGLHCHASVACACACAGVITWYPHEGNKLMLCITSAHKLGKQPGGPWSPYYPSTHTPTPPLPQTFSQDPCRHVPTKAMLMALGHTVLLCHPKQRINCRTLPAPV